MVRRYGQDDLVPGERFEFERAVPPRGTDDAQLDRAVGHLLDDRVRVRNGQRDAERGVLALELAKEERHEVPARSRGGADRERSAQVSVLLSELLHEVVLELEHLLRVSVQ